MLPHKPRKRVKPLEWITVYLKSIKHGLRENNSVQNCHSYMLGTIVKPRPWQKNRFLLVCIYPLVFWLANTITDKKR